MANKKIQNRNKKRKQEQLRAAKMATPVEEPKKKINWLLVAGLALIAVLVLGAGAIKSYGNYQNAQETANQTTTEQQA